MMQQTEIPTFLYGTAWKEDRTQGLTQMALKAGFVGIDTANQRKHYFEAGVGEAIRLAIESGAITRDQLFLQTKFTHQAGQDHRLPYDPDADLTTQVRESFASSLEHLHTDYIDSYVLHGPSYRYGLAPGDWEVWRAMEGLHQEGLVRHLGVSNVHRDQLAMLIEEAKAPISFVQNRCFAKTGWDEAVRTLCTQHGIIYQGFSLLTANRHIFGVPKLQEIAKKHQKTPPQIVFRFAQQVGMLPLTGTTDPNHMAQDLACDACTLDESEVETLLHIG